MVSRKRGLGKGISALIGNGQQVEALLEHSGKKSAKDLQSSAIDSDSQDSNQERDEQAAAGNTAEQLQRNHNSQAQSQESSGYQYRQLPIEFLQPGAYQPRRTIVNEALDELAQSIKAQGVMQPLVVRPIGENKYEIIAGERRWRASQLAGLTEVPCVIRTVSDEAALALAIIENIQREDLSPLEQAVGLQRLKTEFDLTHQQIADAVGRSRTSITNLLRLLNLHDSIKQMLDVGELEIGHAKCLIPLSASDQVMLAKQMIEQELSVRQAEVLVQKFLKRQSDQISGAVESKAYKNDPDILHLQESLATKMGARVKIQHSKSGKGKLVIQYTTLDELEGILGHIH